MAMRLKACCSAQRPPVSPARERDWSATTVPMTQKMRTEIDSHSVRPVLPKEGLPGSTYALTEKGDVVEVADLERVTKKFKHVELRLDDLSTTQKDISSAVSRQQLEFDRVRPSLNAALVLWKQLQLQVSHIESGLSLATDCGKQSLISPDGNLLARIINIEESLSGLINGVAEVLAHSASNLNSRHVDSSLLDGGGNYKHLVDTIESMEKRMTTLESSISSLKLEFTAREELYRTYASATTRALTELIAVGSDDSVTSNDHRNHIAIVPTLGTILPAELPSTYPLSVRQEESSIKRELSREFDNVVEKHASLAVSATTKNSKFEEIAQVLQQKCDRQSEALETLRIEFDTLRLNQHGELLDVARLMQKELGAVKDEIEKKMSFLLLFLEEKLVGSASPVPDTKANQVSGTTDAP